MTKGELKQKLYSYRDLKAERRQIETLQNRLAEPKGLSIDGLPRGPSTGDAMTSIIQQRDALRDLYAAKGAELDRAMVEIEGLIGWLTDARERMIMRYRYLDCLKWENVCVKANYSWKQTHRYHDRALDTILAKYNTT